MDKPDISRRETFRLARFGVLLAVGLGVAENSSAEDPQRGRLDQLMIKGEAGDLMIKLYKVEPNGFEFLKTTVVNAKTMKAMGWDQTQFTIKFWRGNNTLATISDVIKKY